MATARSLDFSPRITSTSGIIGTASLPGGHTFAANGDRTVSQLIPRLNSKYWRVRMETANVIAYLAPSLDASRLEEYMGGLLVALHDDEAAVAAAAAHALAKIGVDSLPVLVAEANAAQAFVAALAGKQVAVVAPLPHYL